MEVKLFDFDKLMASLTGFLETKMELIKLDIEGEVKKVVAKGVIFVFIGLAVAMALVLLSLGLANLLSEYFHNSYVGYGIIAGFYLLLAVIAFWRKDSIYQAILKNLNINDQDDDE